ncbi:Na/Pi cotransporter family protein [Bacillus sp. CGMCC 1.16541]|uniref:Na/Pi cotransporter family protein n=1 Tax=Bacillus sp. CGMCC 1.16541 TaxID=2185143 RepID=UPI000D737850|nr:Na/Pi cotransporter family protein [Bacillus sp. CGMCC 1.16541]
MSLQEILFMFFGGLGIFLFSIKFLGDGLQKAAGDRLREILDRFTTNPIMGVLAGIFVTILLQSSSGTTVLTVGLVSAGFMTLRQAIGVIMGANIGTTVTAFIIGIKISDYALLIVGIGAFLLFFLKDKRINNIGQIVFGFGGLFLGLNLMGDGLKPLREVQAFADLTVSMSDNPLLGVLIGTIFTVSVQSSSASIALLQQLYSQGAMDLQAALPVLFGDNIGTTITALIAAIGATITAKRAALTHVIFNLIGTILVLVFLIPYTALIAQLQNTLNLNPEMTIAFAHGIFNVLNTLIQLPFIAFLAWIVTKAIPGNDRVVEYKVKHLDELLLDQAPSIALGQAHKEVLRMGDMAIQGVKEAKLFVQTNDKRSSDLIVQFEEAINNLDEKITNYLVRISPNNLSEQESQKHHRLINIVRDLERVGDHMENVMELIEYKKVQKTHLSEDAISDLEEMFNVTISTLETAIHSLESEDTEQAKAVLHKEGVIDSMERQLRKKHLIRLNNRQCTGAAGIVFVDIISNLERIGDHSVNIAEAVLDK